jgi:diaminopimelate epimerase
VIPEGRAFYKMSGSGNDFVVIDARTTPAGRLAERDVVGRICAHGTGVGADGIVFVEPSSQAAVRLVYLNADASRAEFCGNATLCVTRLAVELGAASGDSFGIETDSGVVTARMRDGLPEIDLPAVTDAAPAVANVEPADGESRIGYATVGVPHLVILSRDVETVDVVGRGRPLRSHPGFPKGLNVNFVSRGPDGRWRYRTYERGVEAETLACGSGAAAIAILLTEWGEATGTVELQTRSGKPLRVSLRRDANAWCPSLAGEGRVVFEGHLAEL